MGCDGFITPEGDNHDISIHAPGWGATRRDSKCRSNQEISIHAPGWGATVIDNPPFPAPPDFNPRTRVGCDYMLCACYKFEERFQSTHPGGVRPFTCCSTLTNLAISIHAPGWGATSNIEFKRKGDKISIHAPGWGATQDFPEALGRAIISIHAPGWGATPHLMIQGVTMDISIHAPGWGATPYQMQETIDNCGFQSTHPGGVRPKFHFLLSESNLFQSTHPGGVRPNTNEQVITFGKFQSTHPGGVRLKSTAGH